jgi:tRNA A37 threonylcarbamoyladenosine modification protein TsaB
MNQLSLTLTKTDANLTLVLDGRPVAEKKWQESRDMGRQLFESIESILEENGLGPTDIDEFRIETVVPDNFTSVKIAETVKQMYNWAVSEATQTQ